MDALLEVIDRLLPVFGGFAGVWLVHRSKLRKAARTARETQVKLSVDAQRAKDESERGYRDELREENRDLRDRLDREEGRSTDLQNAVLQLQASMSSITSDIEDVQQTLEQYDVNGTLRRKVTRALQKARETSARFGKAGGGS